MLISRAHMPPLAHKPWCREKQQPSMPHPPSICMHHMALPTAYLHQLGSQVPVHSSRQVGAAQRLPYLQQPSQQALNGVQN